MQLIELLCLFDMMIEVQKIIEHLTKTIGEMIYSTLAYSTRFCAPTVKWTNKWHGRLCRAITQSTDLTPGCLKYVAMTYILGLPTLPHHTAINFLSEYFISLNSFRTKWDLSTRVTFRDNPKPLEADEFRMSEPLSGISQIWTVKRRRYFPLY